METSDEGKAVSMKHNDLVNYLFEHSNEIEDGFRCIFKEFWFSHGRIDILGVDKNKVPTTVEVKTRITNKSKLESERQARKYRFQMSEFLKAIGVSKPLRCLLWTPNGILDLGQEEPELRIETCGIPSSREVFGLKKEVYRRDF